MKKEGQQRRLLSRYTRRERLKEDYFFDDLQWLQQWNEGGEQNPRKDALCARLNFFHEYIPANYCYFDHKEREVERGYCLQWHFICAN